MKISNTIIASGIAVAGVIALTADRDEGTAGLNGGQPPIVVHENVSETDLVEPIDLQGQRSERPPVKSEEPAVYRPGNPAVGKALADPSSEYRIARDEYVRLKAASVAVLVKEGRFLGTSGDGVPGSMAKPSVVSENEVYVTRYDSTGTQLLLLTRDEFPEFFHAKDRREELRALVDLAESASTNALVFDPK